MSGTPFSVEHFVGWASRLVLDSGESWELEDFQLLFVEDLFGGRTENLLVLPEGNGKTTLIAGVALYGLRFSEDAMIPVAASSRDQARVMYRQAKGFLRRSQLDDPPEFVFEAFDGYRRIDLRGPGRTKRGEVLGSIEMHAADAGTGDGIIPFPYFFCDELHRHRNLDLWETWRGKCDKRGAQGVGISTAGEAGGEFENMRERVRQETGVVTARPGFVRCLSDVMAFHEYALEEGAEQDDFEAVKRANPLPSITIESLVAKRSSPTMSPHHWGRFVCNIPARSGSAAIAESEWHQAITDQTIPGDVPVWLGIDFGWQLDTTAIVPLWWKDDEERIFGRATILEPPGGNEQLDVRLVKKAISDLCDRYRVEAIVMDSSRAEDVAAWMRDDLNLTVIYRAQTAKPKSEDYERFMSALRNGWLLHHGDDGLKRHALNARTRLLADGSAMFDRPSASRTGNQSVKVIDALTAAAMVHSVLVEDSVGSVYDDRGLTVIG